MPGIPRAQDAGRGSWLAHDVSWRDYKETCKNIVAAFGPQCGAADVGPPDFAGLKAALSKRLSPGSLGNEITRVRVAFNWAYQLELIEKPAKFGPDFKRAPKRVLRAERQRKGPRMLTPHQLRLIMRTADAPLRAMVMLGLNCGFGNADVGKLPLSALDLRKGRVDFPRPKSAIDRRIPLWPETVVALRDAIAVRPSPKEASDARLVFLTRNGASWHKDTGNANPLSVEFRKLLKKLGMHRPGISFYTLRHIAETIGGASGDQVAVNAMMGHVDQSMAAVYREGVGDDRLQRVVETVRRWLFRVDVVEKRSARPKTVPSRNKRKPRTRKAS